MAVTENVFKLTIKLATIVNHLQSTNTSRLLIEIKIKKLIKKILTQIKHKIGFLSIYYNNT